MNLKTITAMAATKISTSTITPLIDLFKMCPMCTRDRNENEVSNMIQEGLMTGYIIHPACDTAYIKDWIEDIDMQYNSTFYKCWGDVTNKSRFELLVDQLVHYMTTYGTDFEMGAGYVPNLNPEEPAWNTYKVVSACTFKDLYDRCFKMLASGSALKSNTVKYLVNYIIEYCNVYYVTPNVDGIKNREALTILCDKLGVLPVDGSKLFSFILYKATGQTMVIKNRATRRLIEASFKFAGLNRDTTALWKSLSESQMRRLAEVYNRYKPLFLAFKNKNTKTVINKIGHLSKKYHKPMTRGFWETVLSLEPSMSNLRLCRDEAAKANNFKLVQVMQSIRERYLLAAQEGDMMYLIRNGKIFIKENNYEAIDARYGFWEGIYDICKAQLVSNLSKKACTIKLPSQYSLTCPTSEKNFIGDFPMGTSCQMGENSVIGIYWRNDWGTRDFDLSFNDVQGNRIGWNSDYYNEDQSVIYSGDITNAPDGANEVLHFRGTEKHPIPSGIVYVNCYNGNPGSKYKIFFGTDKIDNLKSSNFAHGDYMVDPNNLQLEATITQTDAAQQMVGVVIDGRFYFYELSCGYSAIANAIRHKNGEDKYRYNAAALKKSIEETVKIMKRKANVFMPLKDILLEAGFKEVKKNEEPEIDFTNLTRDSLIDLFSME